MYLEPASDAAENAFLAGLRLESAGLKCLSVASHLAFLLPIALLFRFRQLSANVFVILATVVSTAYHVCGVTDHCLGLTFEQARAADHLTAALIVLAASEILEALHERRAVHGLPFWPAACGACGRRARVSRADDADAVAAGEAEGALVPRDVLVYYWLKLPTVIVCVAIASLTSHRFDTYPVYLTAALCLVFAAVRVALFRVEWRRPAPDYYVTAPLAVNAPWMLVAVLFGAIGVLLFGLEGGGSLTHSLWHVMIAFALACLTVAVNVLPARATVTLGDAHRSGLRRLLAPAAAARGIL